MLWGQRLVKKIRNITKGWLKHWGWLETTPAEKKLSELRMTFCKACPESKMKKQIEIIKGNVVDEVVLRCGICKCPCVQKSLVVEEKCPINKW